MNTFVSTNTRFTRQRCALCRIPFPYCICVYNPKIKVPFDVAIVSHWREEDKPTSTGFLTAQSIRNTPLWIWSRVDPDSNMLTWIQRKGYFPCVVYPSEKAMTPKEVKAAAEQVGGQPSFILLDGTWKQTRRILNYSPYLKSLPKVSLSPVRESQFKLRHQHHMHNISTVESAIEILRELEEEKAARHLSAYFHLFQEYYTQTKLFKKDIEFPKEAEILRAE